MDRSKYSFLTDYFALQDKRIADIKAKLAEQEKQIKDIGGQKDAKKNAADQLAAELDSEPPPNDLLLSFNPTEMLGFLERQADPI